MTLTIVIKQSKDIEIRKLKEVKFHHFDKYGLQIKMISGRNHFYKSSTVLEIREEL